MAYFHTCVGCFYASETCEFRDQLKVAIKGLCISALRHRCPNRINLYKRGDAVKVLTVSSTDGNLTEDGEVVRDWFEATVSQQASGKAVVFVAEGTVGEFSGVVFEGAAQGFVRAPLRRIKPSDHEPARIPEDMYAR